MLKWEWKMRQKSTRIWWTALDYLVRLKNRSKGSNDQSASSNISCHSGETVCWAWYFDMFHTKMDIPAYRIQRSVVKAEAEDHLYYGYQKVVFGGILLAHEVESIPSRETTMLLVYPKVSIRRRLRLSDDGGTIRYGQRYNTRHNWYMLSHILRVAELCVWWFGH